MFFYVEPEVAGGFGEHTILNRSTHPPVVTKLHYELDGWLGDQILESFPVFIVTDDLRQALTDSGVSGIDFAPVEVTTSDLFRELYPDRKIPRFDWLRVDGQAGRDDFGTARDGRLVVSKRGLEVLEAAGIPNAVVEPFEV